MRGLKYYFLTTAFIGFIIFSLLLITLVTGMEIVPLVFLERYEGSDIIRIGIYSWGLLSVLFPLAFILFLLPSK
jgi:O-antigen/teichoic acid export membrane protein